MKADGTADLGLIVPEHLHSLLKLMSLSDKLSLIQGADFWTTAPIESIGLRAMTLSDGPSGVRGARWDERDPSLNLPSGSALAASWDVSVAYRYAALAAYEARRKGVHVVLGPTINLHRSPLGGRHFECFSEDPELTAQLAAAYIRGLQDHGVAASPKHYVANDSETDRRTVDVQLSQRALREVYLTPFERAVEADAWTVMSAYNAVNGVTMSESNLLRRPLKEEWGFDGVVVSDWSGVTSLASIPAAQDLAMPGPAPAYADLREEIDADTVSILDIDEKVLRILLLAERVGALGDTPRPALPEGDGRAFARFAAIEGAVLLQNDGVLPLTPSSVASIAVIGHNARDARTQGGGSATVVPDRIVSPLKAIREAMPNAQTTFEVGAIVQEGLAEIPIDRLTNPDTGKPGVRAMFVDDVGTMLFREDRFSTRLVWFEADAPLEAAARLIVEAIYTPAEDETILLGFAGMVSGRLYIDDRLVLDEELASAGVQLGASFLSPPSATTPMHLIAGRSLALRAEFDVDAFAISRASLSLTLGIAPDTSDPDELIARAVDAARTAEFAVVVVGTNPQVESEGHDRTDLRLPGRQDDLVEAVAAVNPRTIVVLNAGAPMVLPWAPRVSAVLQGFFGGQEFGSAVAAILTGEAEPGGRLPTTWPRSWEDVPVTEVTPTEGVLRYDEDIHVGYRAWLRQNTDPLYPFGHGLGFTTWHWDEASRRDDALDVVLRNTGRRPGKQVVQVYAERGTSVIERPERWLVGFAVTRAAPGESVRVTVALPERRFAHWTESGWETEAGDVTLHVGASLVDTPLTTTWRVR
ncbi:beta-glucosidase [Prescottella equi]